MYTYCIVKFCYTRNYCVIILAPINGCTPSLQIVHDSFPSDSKLHRYLCLFLNKHRKDSHTNKLFGKTIPEYSLSIPVTRKYLVNKKLTIQKAECLERNGYIIDCNRHLDLFINLCTPVILPVNALKHLDIQLYLDKTLSGYWYLGTNGVWVMSELDIKKRSQEIDEDDDIDNI